MKKENIKRVYSSISDLVNELNICLFRFDNQHIFLFCLVFSQPFSSQYFFIIFFISFLKFQPCFRIWILIFSSFFSLFSLFLLHHFCTLFANTINTICCSHPCFNFKYQIFIYTFRINIFFIEGTLFLYL